MSTTDIEVVSIGTTDLPRIARDRAKELGLVSPKVYSWVDVDEAPAERKPTARRYRVTVEHR